MFKWIGKIRLWRREKEEEPVVVHDYGVYVYKPVMIRAVAMVMGVPQDAVRSWVDDPEVDLSLNGELIQGAGWDRRRLGSGNYEIKIPSRNKAWRFFIA